MENTNTFTFEILECHYNEFEKRLAKLIKKANQLGCESLKIISKEEITVIRHKQISETRSKRINLKAYKIVVQGPTPKLSNWSFIAKLEQLRNEKNIINSIPGNTIEVHERFKTAPQTCEHCNKNRVRNNVFVLHNSETKEQVQVGRSCLKDFTGHSPEKAFGLLRFLDSLESLGHSESYRNSIPIYEDVVEIFILAAAYINRDGWVSKQNAAEWSKIPTVNYVLNHLYNTNKELSIIPIIPNDAIIEAKEIVEFWKNKEYKNDYEYNIKTLVEAGMVTPNHIPMLCSAVATYRKIIGKIQQNKIDGSKSNYVGTPGEKLKDYEVSVKSIRSIAPSEWNDRTLIQMVDKDGNIFVWFATGNHNELNLNDNLKISGSIKKHNLYNDVKQTQLTRVKYNKV